MMSAEQSEMQLGTVSVFELNAATIASLQNDKFEGLDCFQISQPEAPLVQDVMENTGIYEPDTVLRRLSQGRWGYAGWVSNREIVTYGWVGLDATSVGPTGLDFVPPAGDAYLFDFATVPAHRGHGYYPMLLRFILNELAKHHIRRAWIATAPGNDKSARSIARAGFTKVADVLHVPVSTLQLPKMKLFGTLSIDPHLLELCEKAYVPNGW